jgi:hypothetical protein
MKQANIPKRFLALYIPCVFIILTDFRVSGFMARTRYAAWSTT